MIKPLFTALALTVTAAAVTVTATQPAMAYSCQAQFNRAMQLVKEAEGLVKKDTDARILAMIAEAKGIAQAGIISHAKASQGHTGAMGKFMHSDAVRKGKWAQDLAKQAIFLINGDIK